jgi:hypothetical protein
MKKVIPYKHYDGALKALDNGGRFYSETRIGGRARTGRSRHAGAGGGNRARSNKDVIHMVGTPRTLCFNEDRRSKLQRVPHPVANAPVPPRAAKCRRFTEIPVREGSCGNRTAQLIRSDLIALLMLPCCLW